MSPEPVCHHLDGAYPVAAREAGHPVVESIEPNEDWRWCFVDEVYLEG